MKSTFHFIIGAIVLTLVLVHLLVIGLFICPIPKLADVAMAHEIQYVSLSQVPEHVRQVFSSDKPVQFIDDDGPIHRIASKVLAIRQNKFFGDDERQELYLNTLNFGGDVIGIQSASNYYFQKSASDLSFEESLTLAGLYKIFLQK